MTAAWRLVFLVSSILFCGTLQAQVEAQFSTPVGRSAFAFSLSEDGAHAVVVNLFPLRGDDGVEGANVSILDLPSGRVQHQIRIGTRLTSVAVAGRTAVLVNQDEDAVRLIDIGTGEEITRVFAGSRPATALRLDRRTVVIANGTSGDIAFLDTESRQLTSSITVGDDPRMIAAHPDGRHLYVILGASGALAVVDRRNQHEAARVLRLVSGLVPNPVAIATSPDGSRTLVAGPSSNSVSVLDTSNPARPALLYNLAVGEQPVAIAFDPREPSMAYVANQWGQYLSVVDTQAPKQNALLGIIPMSDAGAAVRFDASGDTLYFLSFSADSALSAFDAAVLTDASAWQPAPDIQIPGEPSARLRLNAVGDCRQDFHIARVELGSTVEEGFWGLEVRLTQPPRELTGGFNLGGVLAENGRLPSFGAFSLSRTRTVRIRVNAGGHQGQTAAARVELRADGEVIAALEGVFADDQPLELVRELPPGFYVVRLRSLPGAPRANFQMALESPGGSFNGGVVVGGFLDRRPDGVSRNGFGAFCLPSSQDVEIRTLGRSEYGAVGSEALVLSVLDHERRLIERFDTALLSAVNLEPPPAPAVPAHIDWHVAGNAPAGGDGSIAAPLNSITEAINRAGPGQTIFVGPGVYGPSTTGETLPIGTRGPGLRGFSEGIQLIGAGADATIIDAELRPGIAVVLNADGLRMAGFTVKQAGSIGVYVFRAANVTLENNVFTANQRFGAGGELSSGLVVRNNNAVSNMESGLAFAGSVPGDSRPDASGHCPGSPIGADYGAWIVDNNSSNNRAVGILLTQGGNYCVAGNVTINNGSSGIELNNRDQEGVGRPPLNSVVINNDIETNGGQQFAHAGTGILATENGATINLIEGNRLVRNRPYGIGVFLDGRVGVIRANSIVSTVSNSILVRVGSSVDEIVDNVITGGGDSGILIANDGHVGVSAGNLISRNNKGLSVLSGSSLGRSERDLIEDNRRIGVEVVDGLLEILTEAIILRNGADSAQGGTGLQVRGQSMVAMRASQVRDNFGQGGVYVAEGAELDVLDSVIDNNERHGLIATDTGTEVTIADSQVTGTRQVGSGSGFGITARREARVECRNTLIENNAAGPVMAATGQAPGCR